MSSTRRALLALLLLAGACPPRDAGGASDLAWRVGPDDFVAYGIEELERTDSRLDGHARWGEIDDAAGFHGHELDRDGRRVTRPIGHAQLLYLPFVFALPPRATPGTRLSLRGPVPVTWRLTPIDARGEVTVVRPPDGAGAAEVHLEGSVTLEGRPADPDLPPPRRLVSGSLTWHAVFDADRGLVREVLYEIAWDTEVGFVPDVHRLPQGVHAIDPQARSCRARVRLTLDRVMPYRDPRFQREVDRAIEQGMDALLEMQLEDGSWGGPRNVGRTALCLLALVDGGRPPDDPAVERGFRWLMQQAPWDPETGHHLTYQTAVAVMAIERRRTPPDEVQRRSRGLVVPFGQRPLRLTERAYVQRCADFLVENANVVSPGGRRVVTGEGGEAQWRWGYPHPVPPGQEPNTNAWDNSNTQYAVLGLESAARCGIDVPLLAWIGIAEHFLAVQAPPGPPERSLLLRHHVRIPPPASDDGEDPPSARGGTVAPPPGGRTVAPVKARPRGWGYHNTYDPDPGRPPGGMNHGSMTAAGIASLAIARARIAGSRAGRASADLLARIDQAILDGFASLDDMFDVWAHPRYEGWYTYWLYGLERAGMLTDVERIGIHDWYWEGAVQLLRRQRSYSTRWPPHWSYDLGSDGSTAWAILFLKRGTPPVITPR